MAVTINSKKGTAATVHVSSANATITVAGNSSVSSIASPGETVDSASITQVFWGCDPNGYIVLKRNNEVLAVYDSTSYYDYAGSGMSLGVNATHPIVVEFVGSANCYVFFEVQKKGKFDNFPYVGTN